MKDCLEATFFKRLGNFSLDVSLRLKEEIGVLFGPSGAGKSQTLKILAGIVKPDKGRISLMDRLLFDSSSSVFIRAAKRKIGLVFQELALFPHLTVLENVAYGLKGPNRWHLAKSWLDAMRLEGFYDRMPDQLSGGQRQRVALARALAPKPDLLLLDEPFSALEGPLRRALRRELKKLFERVKTPILYVTHDIEDVCSLANRVFIMRDGSIMADLEASKLWDPLSQANIWHSLGWGTLIRGEIAIDDGYHWFTWQKGRLRLSPSKELTAGKATVFIPPDQIKLIYPNLPVDHELQPNTQEGTIVEKMEINGSVRLYIFGADVEWHAEYSKDSYLTLNLREGHPIFFSIKPSSITVLTDEECCSAN